MKCVALVNHTKVNPSGVKCGEECEEGFKYCDEHKGRKKAVNERLEKSVSSLSTAKSDPNPYDAANESDVEEERQIEVATQREVVPVTNTTSHRTIVDQVNDMLTRVIDFEFTTFNEFNKLQASEWRYRDKAGAEQIRGEVQIYERAQDRSLRALTAITKLGIEQQAVIVEKAQYEGVRTAIHRTLVRLGFNDKEISQALAILAEEFSKLIPQ